MMQVIVNDAPQELPANSTVRDLLDQLELGQGRVAVEVNKQLVPRAQHTAHILQANDRIEIVTLVGGG